MTPSLKQLFLLLFSHLPTIYGFYIVYTIERSHQYAELNQ